MKKNNTHASKLDHRLNQQADKLHKKHQQRLDKMTAIALNAANDQQRVEKLLNKEADRKSQLLAKKYRTRLEKMTQIVRKPSFKTPLKTRRFSLIKAIFKPIPRMAFASVFALSLAMVLWFDSQHQQATPDLVYANNTVVPAWVNDNNIPLELLENMDFYVWLSQSDYAQNNAQQTQAFLVAAWLNQRGTRQ